MISVEIIVKSQNRILVGLKVTDEILGEGMLLCDSMGNEWKIVSVRPVYEKQIGKCEKYFVALTPITKKNVPDEKDILLLK